MFYRYRFESEIYPGLSLIPLHVRMKLDSTGVKISLKAWLAFSLEEREVLCHLPVETEEEKNAFIGFLDFLSRRYFGEQAALVPPITEPPWEDPGRVPDPVEARSKETGKAVTREEWSRWDRCQRYALFKLAVSQNEPEQFYQALEEFRGRVGKQA